MSKRLYLGIGGFVAGFAVIASLSFLSANTDLNAAKENRVELVTIEYSGGACYNKEEGAAIICSSKYSIFANGFYENGTNLSKDETKKLVELIEKSSLERINLLPEDGYLCPSASDGSDVSFIYPTKYGQTRFTLCQIANPEQYPLLAYTQNLLDNHTKN